MPELKAPSIGSLDESIDDSQATLKKWLSQDGDEPQTKVTIELALAFNPAWCRWLKESGATNQQIVTALSIIASALICETVANTADEKDHAALGMAITKIIEAQVQHGLTLLDKAEPIRGFRRTDA